MTRTHRQTHDAGRHLAAAEALVRGYEAALDGPTSYIQVNGHRVQVQVAAKGAWQISDVDKYTSDQTSEYVVLVDITEGLREFYICPGESLRADVRKRHDQYLISKGGKRPRNEHSKHTAIYPEEVRKWRNAWSRLA